MTNKIAPMLPAAAGYGFIPGLNGLRALSVIIVIIAHMGFQHIVPGGFGVTMFFFISGFLITRLLLAETAKQGQVKLGKFYMRRFIRLYPALLFMVFSTVALYWAFGYGGPSLTELLASVFYFTNIFQVISQNAGVFPFMPWTPLWSLAVEEHFYLVFPLLVVLCLKNTRALAWALGVVIVAALLWRIYIVLGTDIPAQPYTYMMTDARIDSLAYGCLLSTLLHIKGSAEGFRRLIGYLPFGLAIVGLLASFLIRDEFFRNTVRYSLQGVAIFIVILNLYYWHVLKFAFHILDFKPLAWLGTISYPLYLWHMPILDLMRRHYGDHLVVNSLAISLSISVAAFSYYWVEVPFFTARRKFGSHAGMRRSTKATAVSTPIASSRAGVSRLTALPK